ncbi:uncharacterized protein B0H18DRAFT_1005195 [Fomitopsis serialis]|uniref:uncharacterized protein n=1 Tax=Fomitopsis serialis TaxID=139415 RepID=UPI0020073ECC|nr:uncharacterized protein B0H18DRAFT_1005195 [Neoantrodia serialis]KAH9926704.1 hypothetical protein B0H18DRAFT_1005195 [Neoantrodia serialis]
MDTIRIPSPLPDDVWRHIPTDGPMALQKWLVKVHFFVNLAVPINRLPDELLAEILQIVRFDRPSDWSFSTVLLICRHWYYIAVPSACLWSDITIGMSLPLLHTYLRRSRGRAFRFLRELRTRVLSPHFDRVTELHTFSSQPYIEHRMEQLSSLTIDDALPPHFTPGPEEEGATVIAIRGDRFPKLESLTLREIEPVANIVDAHCLTSLTLDSLWHETWSEVLNLLKGCPVLEYLTMVSLEAGSTAVAVTDDVRRNRIIEMRRLRALSFRDCIERAGIAYLLAHLALPFTAEIAIVVNLDEADREELMEDVDLWDTSFADAIPEDKTFLPVFSAIQTVKTTINDDRLTVLAFTQKERGSGTPSVTYSCALGNMINTKHIHKEIMRDMSMVFSPSLSMTGLHIQVKGHENYDCFVTTENWKSLYTKFPHIVDFYAGGPSSSFFDDFLPDLGPNPNTPLPWPKLQRITFENTATEAEPDESNNIIDSIIISMHNRRDAAAAGSVERLQHLHLEFPRMQDRNLYKRTRTLQRVTDLLTRSPDW